MDTKMLNRFVKISPSFLFGFLCSLIVAVAISMISQMPYRFFFSAIFGVTTFLIYCLLIENVNMEGNLKSKIISSKFKFDSDVFKEFFIPAIYAISIFLVLSIPPTGGGQFREWLGIPPTKYVRLFAGLLLSSMLPGYGLLRLIDRERRYTGLDSIIFSFFISIFMMSLIPFALTLLNIPIDYNYWATLIFNIIILVLFFSSTILKKRKKMVLNGKNFFQLKKAGFTENLSQRKLDYLIIIGIFIFYVVGWFVYYSNYTLGSTGDMWDHYAEFLQLIKGIKIYSPPHLAYLASESWFKLHYITVAQLSGFPTVNGFMVYAFINFFYILAFYQMVRGIVGEKHPKVPSIATAIATLFSGLGWVKALSLASSPGVSWETALNTAGSMTYNDIVYSFIYGPIPQFLSLAMIFSLLYLMVRKGAFDRSSIFLTAVLVAHSCLVHMPEIILFPFFYYC